MVSVIVVNYNRAELLRECLRSLELQNWPSLEVVVVDNGSSDQSRLVVDSFEQLNVQWVPLSTNHGFAAATNVGVQHSNGEFIALLNNDAVAEPEWLPSLMGAMATSAQVGMCASKILLVRSGVIDKVGHLMFPDGQNRGRGTGELDEGQFEEMEETFFPDGCAALYRRVVLEEVGGFDNDFFAYGDDADVGVRARWMGWKCLYVPGAVVHHHHSATSGAYSVQKIYWVERNRMWLAVKSFPLPLLLLNPILTSYRWCWNLAAVVMRRGAAGQFRKENSVQQLLMTLFRAYWDGVSGVPKMWRKRRVLRSRRRISSLEFYQLMGRFRIPARTLAFRNPPDA